MQQIIEEATNDPLYQGTQDFKNLHPAPNNIAYYYDPNGNIITDYNKGISLIKYNTLNLPDSLQFRYGHALYYSYDAAGVKRRVKSLTTDETQLVPMGTINANLQGSLINADITDYCGNIIYENGQLSKILTSEGYIADSMHYYYLKDHLGSIRVVFDQAGNVIEKNSYYPFGMLFGESVGEANKQPYKYNGKELMTMHGLNLHDYGARFHDGTTGRWGSMDPLAERYYSISPYVYCHNNPIRYIDPDGREVVISGVQSDEAVRQLQERMNGRITLTRNEETGRLSYTVNEGQKLKGDAKRMAGMIDNQSITVNIATMNNNETSTGNLMVGGAFMGNTVATDANGNTTVVANQEVNPTVLSNADEHTNTMGKMMMHEATEAYAGAQISQKSGVSSPMAGQVGSVYQQAHKKATSQTPVYQTMYDSSGNITTDTPQAVRVEWSVTKNGRSSVIQRLP